MRLEMAALRTILVGAAEAAAALARSLEGAVALIDQASEPADATGRPRRPKDEPSKSRKDGSSLRSSNGRPSAGLSLFSSVPGSSDPEAERSEVEGKKEDSEHTASSVGSKDGQSERAQDRQSSPSSLQPSSPSRTTGRQDGEDDGRPPPPTLRVSMCDAWDGQNGIAISGTNKYAIYGLEPVLRARATVAAVDPVQLWQRAIELFRAAQVGQRRPKGLPLFLEDVPIWLDQAVAGTPHDTGRAGTADEHAAERERNTGFLADA